MKPHMFLPVILVILLSACGEAIPPVAEIPYFPTEAPTATAMATATPELTSILTLPKEFLAQFNGTAYSFKDNQVIFAGRGEPNTE